MIRAGRWIYMLYSTFQTVTSAWFLCIVAICFAYYVIGPVVIARLTDDQADDETDGIP